VVSDARLAIDGDPQGERLATTAIALQTTADGFELVLRVTRFLRRMFVARERVQVTAVCGTCAVPLMGRLHALPPWRSSALMQS